MKRKLLAGHFYYKPWAARATHIMSPEKGYSLCGSWYVDGPGEHVTKQGIGDAPEGDECRTCFKAERALEQQEQSK